MSTKTIGQLNPAAVVPADAVIEVEQNGASRKVNLEDLRKAILAGFVAYDIDPSVDEKLGEIRETIDQIIGSIGDAVSSADSATASEGARQAAMAARGVAETMAITSQVARDSARAARDQAQTAEVAAEAAQSEAAARAAEAAVRAEDAKGFAQTASGQATIATQKADAAGSSASIAEAKANIATTKAGEASTFASNAATSESNALGSKNAAASSAGVAATHAGTAGDKASAAAGSASSAATSADQAGQRASAAEGSRTAAETARGQAETFRNQASTSEINAAGSASLASISQGVVATTAQDAASASQSGNRSPGLAPSTWTWDEYNTFAPTKQSLRKFITDNPLSVFGITGGKLNVGGGSFHIHPYAPIPVDPSHRQRAVFRGRLTTDGTQPSIHILYMTFWDKDGGLLFGNTEAVAQQPGDKTVAGGTFELTAEFRPSDYGPGVAFIRPMFRTAGGTSVTQIDQIYVEDIESEKKSADSASASAISASTASTKATEAGTSAAAANQSRLDAQAANGSAQSAASAANGSAATADSRAAAATQASNLAAGYRDQAQTSANASQSSSVASADSAAAASRSADLSVTYGSGTNLIPANTECDTLDGWGNNGGLRYAWGEGAAQITAAGVNIAPHIIPDALFALSAYQAGSRNDAYYDFWTDYFPVTPGQTYEFSVYAASHRCIVHPHVGLADSTGGDNQYLTVLGSQAGGGKDLNGWERIFFVFTPATNQKRARVLLRKNPTLPGQADSYAWFIRPMVAECAPGKTKPAPYSIGTGKATAAAASARIAATETAVTDGRFAAAQTVTQLRAEYNGTAATVTQQAGAIAGVQQRTAAYWQVGADAGNGRRQLTVYADANGGGGVDIVGDLSVSGDVIVGGSIVARKLNRDSMSRDGTAIWTGSITPSPGQTVNVPWSLTLTQIPPMGRFIYELDVLLATNAGQQQSSTFNGKPAYTNFIADGGLSVRALDQQGNAYVPKANSSSIVVAGTDFIPSWSANVARGNTDTGFILDGDYYTRNVSATYTLSRLNLRVTWVAI